MYLFYKFIAAVAFGRYIDNSYRAVAAFIKFFELLFVGFPDIKRVLRAFFRHCDVRTFHIRAVDIRAADLIFHRVDVGENLCEFFKRKRHGSGAERCYAVFDKRLRHRFERFGGCVSRVRAAAAVNVHINKTGHNDKPRQVKPFRGRKISYFRYFLTIDFYIGSYLFKIAVENLRIFKNHNISPSCSENFSSFLFLP